MIRFLANRYTRPEIIALREAIDAAHTNLTANVFCSVVTCDECRYYRPCRDLNNFLKRLDEILAIPEGVQK